MRQNTLKSYGSVARTLHWLTALIILTNIVLGLLAVRVPLEQMETKVQLFSLHKTLGIAAFAVALTRILWALAQPRPVPLHPKRRAETFLAESVHWVLYAAMLLVPLTGWIEHAATEGYAPILWPLGQGLPLVPKSPALALTMASTHHIFAWMLMGAVALHILGALKHAVIDRDEVLGRMLRGRAAGGARTPHHALPALTAILIFLAGTGYAITAKPAAEEAAPSLEQAASEWRVRDGELGFTVAQMGTQVQGRFPEWTAAIAFDPQTGTGDVVVTIDMSSVTIGTVTEQARSADFFDVANNPIAVFTAPIRPEGDGYVADGTLSLKGQEMPVTLPFSLRIQDDVASMSGQTQLDRRDWKVGDSYADEATVGFSVTLSVSLGAER
ncbi:cytochrome b/b6 domain-containing protein [Paracoccus sp. T5]|uniref:cytochrome b/b6 domain-containing protein n=1 Tax=Paracoccus sp. T5 TaxID=3402161 RepID=UPI003ADEFED4